MKLCDVLKQYRWATKISARAMAAEIGFSPSTLSRIEGGEVPTGSNLAKVLCWLLREGDAMEGTAAVGEEVAAHEARQAEQP